MRWTWGALLCAIVFTGSTGLARYYDDWTFVAAAARAVDQSTVASSLVTPVGLHWSPLWNLIDLLNFLAVGWDDDRFIRLLTLAAYAAGLGDARGLGWWPVSSRPRPVKRHEVSSSGARRPHGYVSTRDPVTVHTVALNLSVLGKQPALPIF